MKIKVKDVQPNPYRNIDHYPLNKEKIMALTNSIEKTGFWDNLVGRESEGKVEIAYGHHRIEALRLAKGYGYDFKFEIPIKDINDAMMIQIMANENMQEWGHDIAVIDETVKVAKEFLEDDPLFLPGKSSQKRSRDEWKTNASAKDIADFLGWNVGRVHSSLLRINSVESGAISKKALSKFTGEKKSQKFISAIKKHDFTKEEQEKIAKQIVEDEVPRANIKSVIERKAFEKKYPRGEKNTDPRVIKLAHKMRMITSETTLLADTYHKLTTLHDEIRDISGKRDQNVLASMIAGIALLQRKTNIFIETILKDKEITEENINNLKQLKWKN